MSGSSAMFPNDYREALALLYVQNQDLADKTPEDIWEMYTEALQRIKKAQSARDTARIMGGQASTKAP